LTLNRDADAAEERKRKIREKSKKSQTVKETPKVKKESVVGTLNSMMELHA
jgi:hypothetical protein